MKHVKKSMFISTILMVVMLIAALSTATFAWYTSNNTAASTSTMVGAAQANDANIGIGFFRGAQANEINFHNLVDNSNQGYLTPVVPAAYYDPAATADRDTSLGDRYTTSTATQASGYIANAFVKDDSDPEHVEYADYRRVVQMNDTQVSQIVAQSASVHAWPGTLTNISAGATGFDGNYEMIYYIPYYVYNNEVAVDDPAPIAAGDAITVASNQYTKVTAEPAADTKVYKVQRVFEVAANGAATPEAILEGTKAVTQDCANQLSRTANFIPQAGTYLVLYYDYQIAPYTTPTNVVQGKTMVTAIDANAVFVGYAGATAGTLNDDQFDIQTEDVIWNATSNTTYPVVSEIKYDSNGFAYLYKTYTAGTYTAVSNKTGEGVITWNNFMFTKAAIDNVGFFKANGGDASIGNYYDGNTNVMGENHYDLGVVTGISATASGNATETFFVTNNGSTAISQLTVSLNVQGDNAGLLRVAIFKNGTYYGTLASANNAPTTFGKILIGSKAADMQTYKAKNQINLGALSSGALNAAEFQLVAWFDGTLLNDVAAGKNCSFTLTFTATV